MSLTITGDTAEIRWSYHRAAVLRAWSFTATASGNTVTAKVVNSDAFKVSQQPLTFVVPRPSGQAWAWPIESLDIVDDTVTARVGPQEG